MSESDTALHDEEVFSDGLPDAVLEVAGSKCWEGPASSFTVCVAIAANIAKLPELLSRHRTWEVR